MKKLNNSTTNSMSLRHEDKNDEVHAHRFERCSSTLTTTSSIAAASSSSFSSQQLKINLNNLKNKQMQQPTETPRPKNILSKKEPASSNTNLALKNPQLANSIPISQLFAKLNRKIPARSATRSESSIHTNQNKENVVPIIENNQPSQDPSSCLDVDDIDNLLMNLYQSGLVKGDVAELLVRHHEKVSANLLQLHSFFVLQVLPAKLLMYQQLCPSFSSSASLFHNNNNNNDENCFGPLFLLKNLLDSWERQFEDARMKYLYLQQRYHHNERNERIASSVHRKIVFSVDDDDNNNTNDDDDLKNIFITSSCEKNEGESNQIQNQKDSPSPIHPSFCNDDDDHKIDDETSDSFVTTNCNLSSKFEFLEQILLPFFLCSSSSSSSLSKHHSLKSFLYPFYQKIFFNSSIFAAFVSRQMMRVNILKNNIDEDNNNFSTIQDDKSFLTILYWNNGATSNPKFTNLNNNEKNDDDSSSFLPPSSALCKLNCNTSRIDNQDNISNVGEKNRSSIPFLKAQRHFEGRIFSNSSGSSISCRPWVIIIAEAGSKDLISFISSNLGYTLLGDVANTGRYLCKSRQDVALFVRNDLFSKSNDKHSNSEAIKIEVDLESVQDGMDEEEIAHASSSCSSTSANVKGRWTSVDLLVHHSTTKNAVATSDTTKRIRIIGLHLHRTGFQKKEDYPKLRSLISSPTKNENNVVDRLIVVGDFNRNPTEWLSSPSSSSSSSSSLAESKINEMPDVAAPTFDSPLKSALRFSNNNIMTNESPSSRIQFEKSCRIDNILVSSKDRYRLMVVEETTPCMEKLCRNNCKSKSRNNNDDDDESFSSHSVNAASFRKPHFSYTFGLKI